MKYCSASVCLSWLLVVLFCGLAVPIWGQTRPVGPLAPKTHRFTYTAVVPVTGVSQVDLVLRARTWAQQVTPAGQSPVITHGPDSSVVRTTGVCPFACDLSDLSGKTFMSKLSYTATISLREGRYQYELTDFFFVSPGVRQLPPVKTPVESFYNRNFKAYNDVGSRYQVNMRTCSTEIADEVLAHLQAGMRQPTRTVGSE